MDRFNAEYRYPLTSKPFTISLVSMNQIISPLIRTWPGRVMSIVLVGSTADRIVLAPSKEHGRLNEGVAW